MKHLAIVTVTNVAMFFILAVIHIVTVHHAVEKWRNLMVYFDTGQ